MQRTTLFLSMIFLLARPAIAQKQAQLLPAQRKIIVFAPQPTCLGPSDVHVTASGIYRVYIDRWFGAVDGVVIVKSSGVPVVDQCAVKTLQEWRFTRNSASRCTVEITYRRGRGFE
jgi:hypothetical protein